MTLEQGVFTTVLPQEDLLESLLQGTERESKSTKWPLKVTETESLETELKCIVGGTHTVDMTPCERPLVDDLLRQKVRKWVQSTG